MAEVPASCVARHNSMGRKKAWDEPKTLHVDRSSKSPWACTEAKHVIAAKRHPTPTETVPSLREVDEETRSVFAGRKYVGTTGSRLLKSMIPGKVKVKSLLMGSAPRWKAARLQRALMAEVRCGKTLW